MTTPDFPAVPRKGHRRGHRLTLLATTMLLIAGPATASDFPQGEVLEEKTSSLVGSAWSGHPVGFSLVTVKKPQNGNADLQVAAYYNAANRKITLAARDIDSSAWTTTQLDSAVGWDSHNYLTMKVDSAGYLHLSGNMHRGPMNYFRSTQPLSSAAQLAVPGFIARIPTVWSTGNETLSTYPTFMDGPRQELLFHYRNHTGASSGNWHLLKYNNSVLPGHYTQATGTSPLFSWTGNYSVYPIFYVEGGHLHALYMWRKYTDAAANYRLSYMRSSDLLNWTDAFGRAVTLPVTSATTTTIIDDVPVNGGLLNGQPKLTLDRDGQPLIAYHKYDANGRSQIYLARPAIGTQSWRIAQLTTSIRRWDFSGGGTLPPGGSGSNSFLADDPLDGLTTVSTNIVGYIPPLDENTNQSLEPDESNGLYVIDETTLTTIVPKSPLMYSAVHQPICASNFIDNGALQYPNYTHAGASMGIMRSVSTGAPLAGQHYYLRWDALPANRDAARLENGVEIVPPAVDLRVYRTACNYPTSQPGTQVQPTKDAAGKPLGFMFKPSAAAVTGSISKHEEAGRVFGDYLQSDATYAPNSHYASWTFTVPAGQGGDYVLGGSTYSKLANDDSFVIELDGVVLEWFLMSRNRWHYQPVTIGASRSLTRFSLEAGQTYTLRLHAREKDAKLEYLWLTPTNRGNKIPTITSLDETSYALASDGTAVSGHWLAPDPARPATDFMAHYSLPIPVKGCYTLLGRTKASSSNGFHLSLKHPTDAAYRARNIWTVPQSGNDWTWRPAVVGAPLLLDPGNLDVKVEGRDYGSKLDAFMVLYKKPNNYGLCE